MDDDEELWARANADDPEGLDDWGGLDDPEGISAYDHTQKLRSQQKLKPMAYQLPWTQK